MDIFGVIMNWLHLLATMAWIGGMAFNVLVLRPSLKEIDLPQRVKLVGNVLNRFIYLAWASILTLFITGIFIAEPSISAVYGILLVIKHVIVLVMVIIVIVVSFILLPKLRALIPESSTILSKLPPELMRILGKTATLVKLNLTLGIVVLLVTEILQEI